MKSKIAKVLVEKIFSKYNHSSSKKRDIIRKELNESKGNRPVFVKTGLLELKEAYDLFPVEGSSKVFKMTFDSIEAKNLLPCDIIINESGQMFEVDLVEQNDGIYTVTFVDQNNCELKEVFTPDTVMGFVDNVESTSYNQFDEKIEIYEDGNKKVKLNKIMRGDVKKYKVYVKNDKGNVVKVNFGDPNMEIKRDNPARRKNFRARHNCDNPGPRWKARYWACKTWSSKPVSTMLKEETEVSKDVKWKTITEEISNKTLNSLLEKTYDPNLYGLVNNKTNLHLNIKDSHEI